MSAYILAILVIAAFLHVGWNVVLKTSSDPLRTGARAMAAALAIVTPIVGIAWFATGRPSLSLLGWGLAVASGVWELAYFVALSSAYRRGDLSTVYPLARGSAAVGAIVVGIVLLGERLGPVAITGAILLVVGAWLVRRPARAAGSAAAWALLTGGAIVGYSAIDRIGSREGPSWMYGWALWVAGVAFLWAWIALDVRVGISARLTHRIAAGGGTGMLARLAAREAHRATAIAIDDVAFGPEMAPRMATAATSRAGDAPDVSHTSTGGGPPVAEAEDEPASWARSTLAGLFVIGAYFLVLAAYAVAPLAIVSPLRESAVVLAAAWGVLGLGEREGAAERLAGAAAIALGAILVAVG